MVTDNDTEFYATNNKGISVVAERFIRALNNKIFKHMTSISKIVHIKKLWELVEQYSYTIHVPIIDVKTDTCIDILVGSNKKSPKLKKRCNSLQTELIRIKCFWLKKLSTISWKHLLNPLMVKQLMKNFMKIDCTKQINQSLNWQKNIERRWQVLGWKA